MRDRLEPLARIEAEFEEANVRVGEATWSIYSGEGKGDLDGAYQEVARILTSRSNRALVETCRSGTDARAVPLLARRLELWQNCFAGAAVDLNPDIRALRSRLQQRIAAFQFELDGKSIPRSELQRILRNEPDRALRHRAWRALAALAEANRRDLHLLIELRNAAARSLGFRDYADLVLKLQEIDEPWLHRTLGRIAAESQAVYAEIMRSLARLIGVAQMAPWDVAFAMRQGFQLPDAYFPADRALETLAATARQLGFAVDTLPIRTAVRDIPFGGYNVAVRIPSDTRFLVNPSEGHGFYTTTFHEYGHSLQAVFTEAEWPILKEYEWVLGAHAPAYSEGMAEVMGEFARRPGWLRAAAGVPPQEIGRYRAELLPAQMAVRLFDLLCNMRIELAAYSGGLADMAGRERRLTSEVRLLEFPQEDPGQWEANTWYTSYPVYWHNYILASVTALQIHDSIAERFGEELNSGVATHLRSSFYAGGNAIPWTERIRAGTGKPLSPDAYLRTINSVEKR